VVALFMGFCSGPMCFSRFVVMRGSFVVIVFRHTHYAQHFTGP